MDDYLEIKLHRNKPTQRFGCTLLERGPGYAVLLYVAGEPGRIDDIRIPAGSRTVAHYWQDRPYVAWRMFDATGSLIGTLFHVCADVQIHEDHLIYDDLLVDVWVSPEGGVRILDEEELDRCTADGLISAEEFLFIRAARDHIASCHAAIIADLDQFERANREVLFAPHVGAHIARDMRGARGV